MGQQVDEERKDMPGVVTGIKAGEMRAWCLVGLEGGK